MAEDKPRQWYPMAAYLYVLHLDGPALAWEYLRRNPHYRRDWLGRCADTQKAARRWGLRLLEDPNLDARDALPDWADDPDHLVHIRAVDYLGGNPRAFGMWRMPGYKSLTHDGGRLVLACQLARRILCVFHAMPVMDFTACRSTFQVMPVQDFTAWRSKISRHAGQDFTESQAGSF